MVKIISNGVINMAFISVLRRVNPLSHYYVTDLIPIIAADSRYSGFSVDVDENYNIVGYWYVTK